MPSSPTRPSPAGVAGGRRQAARDLGCRGRADRSSGPRVRRAADRVPEPALGQRLPDPPEGPGGGPPGAADPARSALRGLPGARPCGVAGEPGPARWRRRAHRSRQPPDRPGDWSCSALRARCMPSCTGADQGAAIEDDAFVSLTFAGDVTCHLWLSRGSACRRSGVPHARIGCGVRDRRHRSPVGGARAWRPPGWRRLGPSDLGGSGHQRSRGPAHRSPRSTCPRRLPAVLRIGSRCAPAWHADAGGPVRCGGGPAGHRGRARERGARTAPRSRSRS